MIKYESDCQSSRQSIVDDFLNYLRIFSEKIAIILHLDQIKLCIANNICIRRPSRLQRQVFLQYAI